MPPPTAVKSKKPARVSFALGNVLWGVSGLFILIAIGGAYLWPATPDSEPRMSQNDIRVYEVGRAIPDMAQRYVLGNSPDFPRGWNQPAIFKKTIEISKRWLAFQVLPAEKFWLDNLAMVPHVATSETGVFSYYKMDRPLSLTLAPASNPNSPRTNLSASEFFRIWKSDSPNDPFISYSQVLHKLPLSTKGNVTHEDVIWPLVYPFDSLLVSDVRSDDDETYVDAEKATFRLWVSSGGGRTVAHHDWSHNWYVVVHGVKRFVLYPPSESSNLYMYPYLHAHATKLQPDVLSKQSLDKFPRFSSRKAIDITLVAGDVLYVPPFWFHDVFSIEPAMSVAVWSPSRDDGLSEALLALGLPISKDLEPKKKLRIIFLWLGALLDAALKDGGKFVERELISSRYFVVGPTLGIDAAWLKLKCPSPESRVGRYARAKTVVEPKTLKKGISLVEKMSIDARGIIMGNYVEIVLHELISDTPEKIFTVLTCFKDFLS